MFKRVLLLLAVVAALVVVPVVAYDNETVIYEEFYGFEKFNSHDTHYKAVGVLLDRLCVLISRIMLVFRRFFIVLMLILRFGLRLPTRR